VNAPAKSATNKAPTTIRAMIPVLIALSDETCAPVPAPAATPDGEAEGELSGRLVVAALVVAALVVVALVVAALVVAALVVATSGTSGVVRADEGVGVAEVKRSLDEVNAGMVGIKELEVPVVVVKMMTETVGVAEVTGACETMLDVVEATDWVRPPRDVV
jgi:hypothetical protein